MNWRVMNTIKWDVLYDKVQNSAAQTMVRLPPSVPALSWHKPASWLDRRVTLALLFPHYKLKRSSRVNKFANYFSASRTLVWGAVNCSASLCSKCGKTTLSNLLTSWKAHDYMCCWYSFYIMFVRCFSCRNSWNNICKWLSCIQWQTCFAHFI